MSLRPTICKASLDISDLDRQYYANHALTIARHPSETDERMMVRLLAFALFADEALAFGAGLSDSDEPDLWAKDLTGDIDCWIEIGQPDPRIVRKVNSDVAEIQRTREIQDFFKAQGAEALITSPEEFQKMLVSDVQKWAKVVKASNARID